MSRSGEFMDILDVIKKRKTTKVYKDGPDITKEQMAAILNAAHLAPTSTNLQNGRIVVLESQKSRDAYAPYFSGFNTEIIKDAKAVFILIGNPWNNYKKDRGKHYIEDILADSNMTKEQKQKNWEGIRDYYDHVSAYKDSLDITTSAIWFSFMDLVATGFGFDSTPLGGINTTDIEKFMLKEKTLKPGERVNLAFAIGYADETAQRNIEHTRSRIDIDKIVTIL